MNRTLRSGILAAGIAMAVGLSGCADTTTGPIRDSPRGVNSEPADTITFPGGFSNVAAKCDGPNRVYVTNRGNSSRSPALAVVANDPRCT